MPAELLNTIIIIAIAVVMTVGPWTILPWTLDQIERWYDRRESRAAAKAAQP